MTSPALSLLLAFPGFEDELAAELRRDGVAVESRWGGLFLTERPARRPIWARVVGAKAELQPVASIGEAARWLKENGRRWAGASPALHRRSELIQEQVFRHKPKPLDFLTPPPAHDWGLWALVEPNLMVAAPKTDSPFPAGEILFNESKEPPSRAYLKLWELFTVHGLKPSPTDTVADFGSCPGGWTWVLARTAGRVIAIDKAPLDPAVARLKNVESLKKDAFRLAPEEIAPLDWFFSDIICEPARLYDLVLRWREAGVRRFVCTIKYKGKTDFETSERFLALPRSKIVHLCANKHEVTWFSGDF